MISRRARCIAICSIAVLVTFSAASRAEDWPKYRRDLLNSGHSAEHGTLANGVTTVISSNIQSLSLKWSTAVNGAVTGTPAVIGDIVYVGTWNGIFYALDAVTGAIKWSRTICICRITGSPAVANGVIYFGASNATLYALNASDGSQKWALQVTTQTGADIWASPAVIFSPSFPQGIVYIGVASQADAPCIQGEMYGVNATTGVKVWTFNAIDQTTCPSGTCVGAGIWSSAALDVPTNLLYISTGNPGSTCTPATANAGKYPDSVLALDMSTGAIVGFFNAIANDRADEDFGSSPILLTTGSTTQWVGTYAQRQWVADASKNGVMYFMPRGSQIGTSPVKRKLSSSQLITSPAFTSACASGGVSNNVFITSTGGYFVGVSQGSSGGVSKVFNDFISGSQMFSAPAIVNDVVFFGSQDFKLHAYSTSGRPLWSFNIGGRVDSGPSVSNGRIYFGSSDAHVRCLSIDAK